jgi:hypothetical protein
MISRSRMGSVNSKEEMMKKRSAMDAKQRAANDKPDNKGRTTKAQKGVVNKDEAAKFTTGSTETVKRGFLLELVKFVKAKGTVDAATLITEFNGRQFDGRKVTVERVHRYIAYCRNHGILKLAK